MPTKQKGLKYKPLEEKPAPLGKLERTGRGFQIIEFKDHNQEGCSLQQSSLALYEQPGTSAVWLGIDNANPKTFKPGTGWETVAFPEDTLFSTRMHLDLNQVKSLIKHLQDWVEHGQFK